MPLYGPSTATATAGANTNMVTIAGMDISNGIVGQGMTISFGARDRQTGDAWVINSVTPNGTTGGTLTLAGTVPTAVNNAPFLIDTRGFLGTDSSYAAAVSLKLLSTLMNLLGTATNLFAGSRQLVLDKVASTAIGRVAFAIAGRTWGDLAQRSYPFTPTGGQATSIETLAVRAFPDGATPIDALLIDLSNGTGDLRKGAATMVAGATVDLGSAPMGKVTITGAATINSFGAGKHLERLVRFTDAGAILTHSAASLDLPGGGNITVRAGDRLHATSDGSGNWRVHGYVRADGTPLVLPASTQRASFRNRLCNGSFRVNQRQMAYGTSVSFAAGAYTVDRWKAGSGGVSVRLDPDPAGTLYAAIASGTLQQVIEGALYIQEGGTYVLSWIGTAQARVNGGAFAPSPLVVTGLPAFGNVSIEFGTGSLQLPQFEPGSVPTAFEYRDDEETRCRRYFRRLFSPPMKGLVSGSTFSRMSMPLAPSMRAVPTVTIGGSISVFDGSTTGTLTTVNGNYSTAHLIECDFAYSTSGTFVSGRMVTIFQGGNGYLDLASEL